MVRRERLDPPMRGFHHPQSAAGDATLSAITIDHLSPAERLSLIEELWDSLDASEVPLTPAQRAELDHRLATADADARRGATWRQLKGRLKQRLR